MPSERPVRRFRDIVENIERIESYVQGLDQDGFEADGKTVDAVARWLSRISEAAVKLGPTAEATCPDQPWPDIRNWLLGRRRSRRISNATVGRWDGGGLHPSGKSASTLRAAAQRQTKRTSREGS